MLLQIALTLRCDTTRVCGLQSGCREYDDVYNTNHLLTFQWNPTHDQEVNTPWLCTNPPDKYADLDEEGVHKLPLDRYQNIKFHALLATGPKRPSNHKHVAEYKSLLEKSRKVKGGTLEDEQMLFQRSIKYPIANKRTQN